MTGIYYKETKEDQMSISYDHETRTFKSKDGRTITFHCGGEVDQLAFLIAGVALFPETSQGAYIEILKLMADK